MDGNGFATHVIAFIGGPERINGYPPSAAGREDAYYAEHAPGKGRALAIASTCAFVALAALTLGLWPASPQPENLEPDSSLAANLSR